MRLFTKCVVMMKLTSLLILAACLQVSAETTAQQVTLSVSKVNVETVFREIEKQTGYGFLYTKKMVAHVPPLTISVKNAPITEVLRICFKDQPLEFTIENKTIVVREKEKMKVEIETPPSPIDVKGRVVNESGEPVEGVSVKVNGTKNKGTVTDLFGNFLLTDVDGEATLVISGINIETFETKVGGRTDLGSIIVQMKVASLQEVVVNKGYYTEKQRFSVSNVGKVTAKELEKQPVNNPVLALQGRIPGLTVIQSTGVPGSAATIRIQGRNNLDNNFTGSDPLIIVDGVPYPSQNLFSFRSGSSTISSVLGPRTSEFSSAGSTLAALNPDDIESIDVLKDADATAIYGSRAANGAILITTKKGKPGETRLDVSFQTGWGRVGHKWDLLNSQQYLEMRREAKRNDNSLMLSTDYDLNGLWDTTRYTDWQKVLIGGTAKFARITASASGGNQHSNYLIGASYNKETTVFPGDFADIKGSVHFNLNMATKNNRLRGQLTGTFLSGNNTIPGIDFTRFITLSPVAPALYTPEGTLNWAPNANGLSSWDNPLSYNYNDFEIKSRNLVGNAIISYRILPGFDIKASLGYNELLTNQYLASRDASVKPEMRATRTRSALFVDNIVRTWIVEPQLTYTTTVNSKGNLDALVGISFQETASDGFTISATGQSSDNLLKNPGAATSVSANLINNVYRYNAFFGRLNYIHNSRYLLNLSARRDGSSRFGSENRFHNFGAIGAGWIFTEESFFRSKIPFVSYGKVRMSYGLMGNDQIGSYRFMSLFGSTFNAIPYQTIRGLESQGISNPYLQWEETRKLQSGLDLGFLKDRLLVTVNYYRNRSNNTLTTVSLPFTTGTSGVIDNFPALIQNSGWEYSISAVNIRRGNFTWNTNFNLTIPKNKLIDFPGLSSSASADLLVIGKSLNLTKNYSFYAIDPATGGFLFKDASGNPTATPNFQTDRIAQYTTDEKFYGGISNSLSYNGFQLSIFFQFTKQYATHALTIGGAPGVFNSANSLGNQPVTVLNRWQKPGDLTSFPRYRASGAVTQGDWAARDASFVRLKNVSLSYTLPQKIVSRMKFRDASVFINGQNIFTITNYEGLDPETRSLSTLPPLRMITTGVRVGL